MNWTDFIIYLSIAYLTYYGINVIIDLLKLKRGSVNSGEDDVLEFSEIVGTTIIEGDFPTQNDEVPDETSFFNADSLMEEWIRNEGDTEELELISENVNVSSGGVTSMQELMRLAQDQSIEVKKHLVF